ncbi:MAG TPA: tRNA preQ1(34) S-adenosylmethionine ribosyltransferase-isomerase QueA [Elusimicrobiota bacterium]|nr:tRNA preQ1(34) S-adenosylmethionine ribosyltransferase-isomerase QueA [Elusimicrobiota bacterium]
MKLSDFAYALPPSCIAQEPASPRDASRLMVARRGSIGCSHHYFRELDQILDPDDVLVMNDTRVFPARLRGAKPTGGKVEVLLLETMDAHRWRALVRGVMNPTKIQFPDELAAEMENRLPNGEWVLRFSRNHVREYLEARGEMPLPPYVKRTARRPADRERYQTVYARTEGAVAAPTAGFHFTPELLSRLENKGVKILTITLHVGWGTFRPIHSEDVRRHAMLPERYVISAATAEAFNALRRQGRRIVAVGTTSVRALETASSANGELSAATGSSELYIYPGYRFKALDALITNFHLPDSTPLLLANAFHGATADQPFSLRPLYEEAIRAGYRFFSYGDAMLIQ